MCSATAGWDRRGNGVDRRVDFDRRGPGYRGGSGASGGAETGSARKRERTGADLYRDNSAADLDAFPVSFFRRRTDSIFSGRVRRGDLADRYGAVDWNWCRWRTPVEGPPARDGIAGLFDPGPGFALSLDNRAIDLN